MMLAWDLPAITREQNITILAVTWTILWISWGRILKRLGYRSWFAICFAVPGLGQIMLIWAAFAKWPILKELASLKEKKNHG